MPGGFRPWPYATKAIMQHSKSNNTLSVWVTFRHPMDQTVKPAAATWSFIINGGIRAVSTIAWVDAWTLLLTRTPVFGAVITLKVYYTGPDPDLRTIWDKQWEPFGPILSEEIPKLPGTLIFSTGPAPQDNVNIFGLAILFLDCSANDVVIGGFINGVDGQVLHIARLCAAANNATLEHNEGTANQNIFLHKGLDETLTGEYGGWSLACDGSNWYDVSHAKHV